MDEPLRSALTVVHQPRWLVVELAREHEVLSWAVVGGGRRRAHVVAWHEVDGRDLGPAVDPHQLFQSRLAARKLTGAVGLLTSRRLDRQGARGWWGDQ